MNDKSYAVYLTETSNEELNSLLDRGFSVEGILNFNDEYFTFSNENRIVFQFDTILAEDGSILFKSGTEYYKFAYEPLEVVKAVS